MNTDLKEIEQKLHELKPAKLPDDLSAKIENIFENSDHIQNKYANLRKIIWFPKIQKLSAVAALLIAFVGVFFAMLNDQNSSNETTASKASVNKPLKRNQFIPLNAKNVFEGVQDEGLFLSDDKIPYHDVRYQFSDSFLWKNEEDGSLIEMKVPSQRLFFVPIKTD
ncbi:MAG TPA: hypothetical protein EYG40_14100 [Verrucomicrobia bacterium]|nr:hypothetical protein [Verrucomicrobiales bacterium]HIL56153.1 hypothetical protein [Verrucomicrobiota bacterium]